LLWILRKERKKHKTIAGWAIEKKKKSKTRRLILRWVRTKEKKSLELSGLGHLINCGGKKKKKDRVLFQLPWGGPASEERENEAFAAELKVVV